MNKLAYSKHVEDFMRIKFYKLLLLVSLYNLYCNRFNIITRTHTCLRSFLLPTELKTDTCCDKFHDSTIRSHFL